MLPGTDRDLARSAVDEGAELTYFGVTHAGDEAGDQAAVQATDELGMLGGDVGERAVGEGDDRRVVVVAVGDDRVEAETVEVGHQGLEAGGCVEVRDGTSTTLVPADILGITATGTEAISQAQNHPCQHRHGRWLETERRRTRRHRVPMLRPPELAPRVGLDVDEADVAHPLEVRTHGVGVEAQRVGDIGGGERSRRARQLEVDRVPRVVAERLEDIEMSGVERLEWRRVWRRIGQMERLHCRRR